MPWNKPAPEVEPCSGSTLVKRAHFLELVKLQGLKAITNKTGCLLPCYRMVYRADIITSQRLEIVLPRTTN